MSNKNEAKKKITNLIVVKDEKGKVHELWGLLKERSNKNADLTYIDALKEQLQSTNPEKVKEATNGLIFLNAALMAEYFTNFNALENLGIKPGKSFRKETYDNQNAFRRDFFSKNLPSELEDSFKGVYTDSLGDLIEARKKLKKKMKYDLKRPLSTIEHTNNKQQETKSLPVKTLSGEALEAFKKNYKGGR